MKIKKVIPVRAMRAHTGNGGIDSCILNLALDGGEWSASHPCLSNSGKESMLPIEKKVEWTPDLLQMVYFWEFYNVLSPPAMEL
jgi:hypothetical protein